MNASAFRALLPAPLLLLALTAAAQDKNVESKGGQNAIEPKGQNSAPTARPLVPSGSARVQRSAPLTVAVTIVRAHQLRDTGNLEAAQQLLQTQIRLARPLADRHKLQNELADLHFLWAEVLEEQDDLAHAAEHYLAAYETDKTLRRSLAATDLNNVGLIFSSASQYPSALDYLRQALAIRLEIKDRQGEAKTRNNIGLVYRSMGRYPEALASFQTALPLARAVKDRQTEAITLSNIGVIYDNLSRYDKALAYYRQSLPIRRELKDRRGEANTLANIGVTCDNLGQYQNALAYFGQALPIQRALKDREGEATTLAGIGGVYDELGQSEKALTYYEKSLPITREIEDRAGEAATMASIGTAYLHLSRYDEALKQYQAAFAIQHEIGAQADEAGTLSNVGMAYRAQSQYAKALDSYRAALVLRRKVKDRGGEAATLTNIGEVYWSLSQYQKALAYYAQALPIQRAIGDRSGQASTLNNIGAAYMDLGQYQKALTCYLQSLPLNSALKNRRGEAVTLVNMGEIYQKAGRYEDALEHYQSALPLQRAVKDRDSEATTLNNIGLAYESLHRYNEALTAYGQAFTIHRAIHNRTGQAIILHNLMGVAKAQGQTELAVLYGKQSVNLLQAIRRDMRGLHRESQKSYLQANQGTYEQLAALLIGLGRLPEAEQVTRMLREAEVFEFVRGDASQSGLTQPVPLSPQEQAWLDTYAKIAADATRIGARLGALRDKGRSRTAEESAEFATLQTQQEAINGRWEVFRRELAAALAKGSEPPKVDITESEAWQAALRQLDKDGAGHSAVLTTVAAPDRFYVILATKDTRQQFSYPIKAADLNVLVEKFRRVLTDPGFDPVPLAQQIYKVVFCDGQVEHALQGAEIANALWFLNGTLRYVPLDALHDGSEYLVQRPRLNVVMTLSSREFLGRPEGGDTLGVGSSQPHTVSVAEGDRASETLEFGQLPNVPAELRGIISDTASGGTGPMPGEILLDKSFTAEALQKALSEGFKSVHVATHFRLSPGDDANSFLLLGDGGTLPVLDWKVKMNLQNVELLTLSACETGLSGANAPSAESGGRGAGNDNAAKTGAEVGSLGEVAQRMGAAAVVASLWPVADPSTSRLMRGFYGQWHEHPELGKGAALRASQLALLNGTAPPATGADEERAIRLSRSSQPAPDAPLFHLDPAKPFAHPYYWAPFILMGNWR